MRIDVCIKDLSGVVSLFDNERYADAWDLVADRSWETADELRTAGMIRSCLDGKDQDAAKDLLTQSMRGASPIQVARSQIYLALCYWRAGEMQEALACSEAPLSVALVGDDLLRAKLARAVILRSNGRLLESLNVLEECEGVSKNAAPILLGKLHNQIGLTLHELGKGEPAAIQYELASFCFEACGNYSLEAVALNNVAGLLFTQGKFSKARATIDRAISLFAEVSDGRLGNALDQRAQIQIAEGNFSAAERSAKEAVEILGKGNPDFLAEALVTHGRALAKLKRFSDARSSLEKASSLCDHLGDKMRAGEAYAVMVEELPLDYREALSFFLRADELLSDRGRILALGLKVSRLIEPSFIKLALENANGSVTKAAKSLGLYHSLLITRIEKYSELEQYRKPARVRRWKRKPYKVLSSNKAALVEKSHKDKNPKAAK